MNSKDKQLDELLRQIDVPVDLKSRLRRIPDLSSGLGASEFDGDLLSDNASDGLREPVGLPAKPSGNRSVVRHSVWPLAVALSVAASLAAFGVYVQWFAGPPHSASSPNELASQSDPSNQPRAIDEVIGESTFPAPAATLSELESLEQEIAANEMMIESLRMRTRIDQLDQQLSDLNRAAASSLRSRMAKVQRTSSREEASLILALSSESALHLGVERGVVLKSLQHVVEQFPETRGADRAQQFLNTKL